MSKPKRPTNLTLLTGETRPSRVNYDEPQPNEGPLLAPTEDDETFEQVWDYTVEQLEGMGIAFPSDRDALVAYCEAVVTHRRACAGLAKSGMLLRNARTGAFQRNPLIQVQRDSAAVLRAFAREFGLTPSSRADISMGGGERGVGAGPERLLS